MMTKWQKFVQSGAFARPSNLSLFLECVVSNSTPILGVLAAILVFVIVNQIWSLALTGALPSSLGKPFRFVYVNDELPPQLGIAENSSMYLFNNLLKDKIVRSKYLDFAQANGIVGQFLGVGYSLDKPKEIGEFLTDCKNAGIRSTFMCAEVDVKKGAADPVVLPGAISSIQKTLDLIEKLDYSLWPESIQTNIEGLGPNQVASQYFQIHVDAQKLIATRNAKHNANLRLSASVGWWWTSWGDPPAPPTVDYEEKVQPYGQALLKLGVDCVPQIYKNLTTSWHKEIFPAWVAFAEGTSAQVFPAIWINRTISPASNEEYWLPSVSVPSGQVEGRILELAQLSSKAGLGAGSALLRPEFGGIAIFDAVSYSAFLKEFP